MTEQLTPELKTAFEAIARRYETGKIGFRQALEEAHNLDKWVDVRIEPPADHQDILVWRPELKCHCLYEFNSKAIDFIFWQPLPAAPIPSHTITKGEEEL